MRSGFVAGTAVAPDGTGASLAPLRAGQLSTASRTGVLHGKSCRIGGNHGRATAAWLADEASPLRVGHRLKTIVRTELPVNAMQVVPERLGGNTQRARDDRRVVAFCEQLENTALLAGERLDGSMIGRVVGERADLSGDLRQAI